MSWWFGYLSEDVSLKESAGWYNLRWTNWPKRWFLYSETAVSWLSFQSAVQFFSFSWPCVWSTKVMGFIQYCWHPGIPLEILQLLGIHHGWNDSIVSFNCPFVEGLESKASTKNKTKTPLISLRLEWWPGSLEIGCWTVQTFHFHLSRMWDDCSFAQAQWILFNLWHQSSFLAAKLERVETISQVFSFMCCTLQDMAGLNHSVQYKHLEEVEHFEIMRKCPLLTLNFDDLKPWRSPKMSCWQNYPLLGWLSTAVKNQGAKILKTARFIRVLN